DLLVKSFSVCVCFCLTAHWEHFEMSHRSGCDPFGGILFGTNSGETEAAGNREQVMRFGCKPRGASGIAGALRHLIPAATSLSRRAAFLLAVVACFLAVPNCPAQPSLNVIGAWGGSVNSVYVDSAAPDIAYVCAGRRLVILDVAD